MNDETPSQQTIDDDGPATFSFSDASIRDLVVSDLATLTASFEAAAGAGIPVQRLAEHIRGIDLLNFTNPDGVVDAAGYRRWRQQCDTALRNAAAELGKSPGDLKADGESRTAKKDSPLASVAAVAKAALQEVRDGKITPTEYLKKLKEAGRSADKASAPAASPDKALAAVTKASEDLKAGRIDRAKFVEVLNKHRSGAVPITPNVERD